MGKEQKNNKKHAAKSKRDPEKVKKSIEKAGKSHHSKAAALLKIDAKTVKNKERRKELVRKQKLESRKLKKLQKLKEKHIRAEQGEAVMPKKTPRTIEKLRAVDETYIKEEDPEVMKDEEIDEFADYFKEKVTPKLLVTTCRQPKKKLFAFLKELQQAIPEFYYYPRKNFPIKKIVEWGTKRGFTDVLVFGDRCNKPNSLIISHLPRGPTATFKITNVVTNKEIWHHGNPTKHLPELILNNFDTRLGHRVGRMLAALFPQRPEFLGRRVITLHNQRDFIFFRHHRYMFDDQGAKANLQEIGPRFTLRLLSLQHGTFDTASGEYEWVYRPDMYSDRTKFYL